MWSSYSARHAAQLIGLTESAVRSCIRDGLIGAPGEVPARLSFRDLAALRTAKALMDAGRVHVRGQVVTVGQLELPLLEELAAAEREAEPRGDVRALPRAVISEGPAAAPVVTADEWLARALALEDSEPAAAVEAYQRSLRLRPDCSEAWINLGRLHAESSNPEGARQFRIAFANADRKGIAEMFARLKSFSW